MQIPCINLELDFLTHTSTHNFLNGLLHSETSVIFRYFPTEVEILIVYPSQLQANPNVCCGAAVTALYIYYAKVGLLDRCYTFIADLYPCVIDGDNWSCNPTYIPILLFLLLLLCFAQQPATSLCYNKIICPEHIYGWL